MIQRNEPVTDEILKRPFVRPLLFWIAGILLYVCFPLQIVSIIIPAFVLVLLLVSNFLSDRPEYENYKYRSRWVWGVIFACITVFLSIQMTALAEMRLQYPSDPGFLMQKAKEIQLSMVEKLDRLRLPDKDKSVLATITINYRGAVFREVRDIFSVTGVAHILSVSGYHVGIVGAFAGMLLSFLSRSNTLSRWIRYIIMILCVWAFSCISGLSAASMRAAVMMSLFLTANVLNRYSDRYNSLAGAAFCMLVYNPLYLFDIGFQLSYTAVFFILYLQPKLNRLLFIRNPLLKTPWGILTVTVSAQIGTFFLCCFYFGRSSAIFLFTNLIMSLLSSIIIPATLIFMIVPAWFPGVGIIQVIIEYTTRCMMWIVESFASLPYASFDIKFDLATLILSYLSLAMFLIYMQNRRFRMLIASLALVLLVLVKNIIF